MNRRRKILLTAGIVLGTAILLPVIHHYQLRAATEAYIAQLKAKGEPMELAQVIPPPVPPEQNSADTFREAVSLIDADKSLLSTNTVYGMRMVAPGRAMVQWQQPDVRDSDATNSWENVAAAVAQNAKAVALLQQIIEKPEFDFQIKYDRGIADLNFTNFYLAESKRSAQRLESAALCALHHGDTVAAVKNLRAMLALVKAMRNERLIISELVRIAITAMAQTVTWEILQAPNVTDAQLAAMQQDWMNLNFIQGEENAMAMEFVSGRITTAKWRSSSAALQDYFDDWERAGLSDGAGTDLDALKIKAKVFLWRYWWSYPDEVRALENYEVFLNSARFAETNGSFHTAMTNQQAGLAALKLNQTNDVFDTFATPAKADFHSLLSGEVRTMSSVFNKVMRIETAKQMTVTAIALKRYQLKNGKYPASLDALVPGLVAAVPVDPVNGEPLHYRPNPDGTFLLYSVGENGVDDGGDPALEKGVTGPSYYWQNPHALDWVWPQPATAGEIQKYYAAQAKKAKN
jgi:hypothetical protein